jgi:nucleotide-binding universal stress UspA family protein
MSQQSIQSLIVGVDFSKYSKILVQEAEELSRKLGATCTYVFVSDESEDYFELFPESQSKMRVILESAVRKKYRLNEQDRVSIGFGKPYQQIIEIAKQARNPMIVVGHRGKNPVVQFFLGSTAERLALSSPYPVWIHRGQRPLLPRKVLIPCDLSSRSEHTISELGLLRKSFNVRTELFHVTEDPTPILDYQQYALAYEQLKKVDEHKLKTFKKKHPRLRTTKSSGDVVEQIQKRAKDFDLVAISPRVHGKFLPSFGSVTSKLVRSGHKPILILP